MIRSFLSLCIVACSLTCIAPAFAAKGYSKLDDLSLERWALLRETERYQLKIAEKAEAEANAKAAGTHPGQVLRSGTDTYTPAL